MNRSEADRSLAIGYTWQNANGSAMNATFERNKRATKAQTGLK